jgi:hypothetical protein
VFERSLLVVTIAILPLQDHLPAIAGFSVSFLSFAVLALYVIVKRPRALARVWLHPIFLAVYALVLVAAVVESLHSHSRYAEIMRIGQMAAGGVFIAALYRDKAALRWGFFGYLIAGVWMSVFIVLTSYGVLRGLGATDFNQASQVRAKVFAESDLHADLNGMAFIAGQGVVVALASALTAKTAGRRNLWLGIALLCLLGALLTMSRGGIAIIVISCATILWAYRIKLMRTIVVVLVLIGSTLMLVPDVVFSRLTLSAEEQFAHGEARADLYRATFKHLHEFVITGVGAGNYWGPWGMQSAFAQRHPKAGMQVSSTHNVFISMAIYWGIAGLFGVVAVFVLVYRYLPRGHSVDDLRLCLLGLTASVVLVTLVVSDFYAKDFSLGFGMLVGARLWIWPQHHVRLIRPLHRSPRGYQSRRPTLGSPVYRS